MQYFIILVGDEGGKGGGVIIRPHPLNFLYFEQYLKDNMNIE